MDNTMPLFLNKIDTFYLFYNQSLFYINTLIRRLNNNLV